MRKVAVLFLLCLVAVVGFGQPDCIPPKPEPARFVNNFSKEFPALISAGSQQSLEEKLQQFNRETSNQIVIVIVDDLCGYDANEFSTRLGHQWGVGQGKFDNGIVVMLKPTGGEGQRDAYIAVGYGLEGVIPDAIASRVLHEELLPRLGQGEVALALDATTDKLMALAKKEFSYSTYQSKKNWKPLYIFLIILAIYIFLSFRRKTVFTVGRRGRTYHGGWGGGFGGGGWGSGGGGGGFGGGSFGGGGFGGGGAGGKW